MKSSDPGSAAERTKKVRYEDITVVKELDKASPKLMEYCARGWAVPSAMVDFVRKPGGAAYATLHLDRVLITSYHIVARNPDDQPTEQVTLKFGSASLSATDQGETGVWETTFDVTSGILSTLNVNRIGPTGKPPRFNPIPTQILNFGAGVNSFEFEIGDEDTPLSELTFTARSDLPALFPPSAFQFSGIGPRRRLTIAQPKAGTVPTMRVAVEVSDGTHTATYYVVVATGDDSSPAIAFSPKPLAEHSPAGTVAGTFSLDPATPGATFALIDTASGRFRIEGDELLVDDPLLLDYESDPNPEITVESDAGTGSVATVSVPIQDIPEGPYDLWLADQFTPSQLLDPNISGPFADFDKDVPTP
ncbi:MAG: type VI secretion system tube protein Hcp [Verrucomicrobiales bacterium]